MDTDVGAGARAGSKGWGPLWAHQQLWRPWLLVCSPLAAWSYYRSVRGSRGHQGASGRGYASAQVKGLVSNVLIVVGGSRGNPGWHLEQVQLQRPGLPARVLSIVQ